MTRPKPRRSLSHRIAVWGMALWLGSIASLGEGLHEFVHAECLKRSSEGAASVEACECGHSGCHVEPIARAAERLATGFSRQSKSGHVAHECDVCRLLGQLSQLTIPAAAGVQPAESRAETIVLVSQRAASFSIGISVARGPPATNA